jgi:hypothetical protein
MDRVADLTRPIIGIENRTAQEAFDIMSDRIRHALLPNPVSDTRDLGIQEERESAVVAAARDLLSVRTHGGWLNGPGIVDKLDALAEAVAALSTTIERDTVDGREAAEKLASEHIPEIGDAFTSLEDRLEAVSSLADAILALSPASTDIEALREAWIENAKAAMSPLVDEDMPEPMRDAWLTDLAVAALSATPEKGV